MKPITIPKNYRVTIPAEIRKQFGLKSGQKIIFFPNEKTISIVVIPLSIQKARGMFKDINTDIQREEVDEER
jgi:AbrB family looped-hinge helix DNA binding protein